MWTHLEPHSAKLEQVFEPLHAKAVLYDSTWSIAELRLPEDDVRWLRSWFGCITSEDTEDWIKSDMLANFEGNTFVTYRQMFGSLLICAGAEVCREKSGEDSVWPTIRDILPKSDALRHDLFLSNGQPSHLTKEIITDAVRALNLRHAMDIEGTQQWFTTIKLQYGFTYRGAKNRLAEWLVNLGRPHAVQYLNGESEFSELTSDSFKSLWRVLKQYRQGLIEEREVRTTLQRNSWIKPHWINDLLEEAKAKIATLGTGEKHSEEIEVYEEALEEELCPIASIAIEWPQGTSPRLRFQLDRQTIKNEITGIHVRELDFYVDGKKVTRWTRQKDLSWAGCDQIYAEPERHKRQPNLSPRTLVIQSGSGESLLEWDFADSGLSEEVLLFDMDRGRIIKAGEERLEPNRQYTIVCDSKCEIKGCNPVERFERNGISRKAIRLASPLDNNICIVYEDFVLWQPVRAESDQRTRFSLILKTPGTKVFSLRDRSKLLLENLPEDAESIELLIHTKKYEVKQDDGKWCTSKEVLISPELAARQRRVRVRFSSGGRTYTQKPRLELSLLGAAMLRYKQDNDAEAVSFEVLKQGDQLNRSEGTASLKIWTPKHDKGTIVLEDDCNVGRLRHQKIKLRDIHGHGGELHVMNQGEQHNLGVTCFDRGHVRNFWPSMLGCDAQLSFLSDKKPAEAGNDGYMLYLWYMGEKHKAKHNPLPNTCIQPSSTNRVWKIRDSCNPMSVALTWKGHWLGAWWSLERIRDYIDQAELREKDFAIMKWLRVPVLHSTLSSVLAKSILKNPCRFIRTWLNDSGLPEDLRPHENILGLDSVVRHFLWNNFPPWQAKDTISIIGQCRGDSFREDRCFAHLTKLSHISPILLWKGLERCKKREPRTICNLLEMFIRTQVGLSSRDSGQKRQIRNRLSGLEKRALSATGLSEERLKDILRERFESMEQQHWSPLEQDCADLLRLGETQSGRRYLSACMASHWLNRCQE